MFFSNTHTDWPQLPIPFYSILFETSIYQFNSSKRSPIMPDEIMRTPDKRSETIPSSRITPDPLDSQLHVSASSLQFTSSSTGFRSEDLEELGFVLSDPFLCCFWCLCLDYGLLYSWKIQTWTIIRFQTESVIYRFFYLLVFDRIHDAMCLNKMSRTEK